MSSTVILIGTPDPDPRRFNTSGECFGLYLSGACDQFDRRRKHWEHPLHEIFDFLGRLMKPTDNENEDGCNG